MKSLLMDPGHDYRDRDLRSSTASRPATAKASRLVSRLGAVKAHEQPEAPPRCCPGGAAVPLSGASPSPIPEAAWVSGMLPHPDRASVTDAVEESGPGDYLGSFTIWFGLVVPQ